MGAEPAVRVERSFCRVCSTNCALLVEIVDGRAVRVTGDKDDEVYRGFTCVKGRAQPERLSHPDRLLHSMKRRDDGTFEKISTSLAMDEIAERLLAIRERYGPRAIAGYVGTNTLASVVTSHTAGSLWRAIGTPIVLSPGTIDQPGKNIAKALHGGWMAPAQGFDRPDVAMLIGQNPLVSFAGAPFGHPGWIVDQVERGMQLIVIDPRESEIARRATLFLQPKPGEDAAILAAMLRVIIDEQRHDEAFVAENVTGVEDLRRHLEPFAPAVVARRADVDTDDLVRAARIWADAERGYTICGTGPSMSGHSTFIEYLLLNIQTLCGRYLRAGEHVRSLGTLVRVPTYRAQAAPPTPARDHSVQMRVRGLTATPAGVPVAAIPDEMLMEGEERIRALVSVAGNPAGAWPDQVKTVEALRSLDLLVQFDPMMSQTARLAHYVLAPKMSLEVAGATMIHDFLTGRYAGYGPEDAYAHYTPPIVDPPNGSDLLEDWEFVYGIGQRMGLQLSFIGRGNTPMEPFDLDMTQKPTTDEMLDLLATDARVSLDVVRGHRGGRRYPEPKVFVQPKEEGWTHRLDVANQEMMGALDELAGQLAREGPDPSDEQFPYRLVCRRTMVMFNTFLNDGNTRTTRFNPAFMHPADMAELELQADDLVEIRSVLSSIRTFVRADASLRRGLVSISHGYGGLPEDDDDPATKGVNVDLLIPLDLDPDPYSGQPRMSNLPVHVRRLTPDNQATRT